VKGFSSYNGKTPRPRPQIHPFLGKKTTKGFQLPENSHEKNYNYITPKKSNLTIIVIDSSKQDELDSARARPTFPPFHAHTHTTGSGGSQQQQQQQQRPSNKKQQQQQQLLRPEPAVCSILKSFPISTLGRCKPSVPTLSLARRPR
jgi:hypothetical protein